MQERREERVHVRIVYGGFIDSTGIKPNHFRDLERSLQKRTLILLV